MANVINLLAFESDLEFILNLVAWLAIAIILSLLIYKGIGFVIKGQAIKDNKGQRTFFRGIGMFMTSVALGQAVYLLDYVWEQIFGVRIFGRAPYSFATLIDRDYYVLIFTILLFSAAFLIYPLERYMLERKKIILTVITAIAIPIPQILRVTEYFLGGTLTTGSALYLIFSILWYTVITILIIVVAILFVLYIQVGRKAPTGSPIMKKSIAIIIGFLLWLGSVFVTSPILKQLETVQLEFEYFIYPFVIPLLLGISLKLILYGYKEW